MGFGIKLLVWGDYACFTRPEMKGERVSYDVITPSAARGVLDAIYWHPGMRWVVDKLTVLKEIRFDSIRRNELGSKAPPRNIQQAMRGGNIDLHQYIGADRQQRATLLLRDVSYIIEAHFKLHKGQSGENDSPEKHYNIFLRRARVGQCYNQPYFGCREFPAHFRLLEDGEELPQGCYADEEHRDLGWMLWDMLYHNGGYEPKFFRAEMRRGVIDVQGGVTA
jgi:CRISPR-associated protein Cas5d